MADDNRKAKIIHRDNDDLSTSEQSALVIADDADGGGEQKERELKRRAKKNDARTMSGATFEWKTDDLAKLNEMKRAKFKQRFSSSIFSAFGFRWYLDVRPNGWNEQGYVNLYLYLAAFPPKIKSIAVSRTLQCIETKTKDQSTKIFDKKLFDKDGFAWPDKILATKDIQKCASLTFTVSMELAAVFDVNGYDVTDLHDMRKGRQEKLKMLFVRLDSLTTNMDKMMQRMSAIDEQKESMAQLHQQMNTIEQEQKESMAQLQQQVSMMQQQVNKLMLKDMDPEQQRFKWWFESTDCLSAYYDAFVSHGVTDFAKFTVLGMQDLKSIGVEDIQHQMLLLTKVLEVSRNQDNNCNKNNNEGNSAYFVK